MTVAEAVTLIAAVGGFLVATAGAFVSVWNAVHVSQVHTAVNGQAARFEMLAKQAGFAEGTRGNLKLVPQTSDVPAALVDIHSS